MNLLVRLSPLVLGLVFNFSLFSVEFQKIETQAMTDSYQLEKKGNFKASINSLMSLYLMRPTEYFLNLRLGWLYYQSQKYKNALYHYSLAQKSEKSSINAVLGMSYSHEQLGEIDESIAVLLNFNSQNPFNMELNIRLASLFLGISQYTSALAVYEQILRFYPENTSILVKKAVVLFKLKKIKNSKEVFYKILQIDPSNTTALKYMNTDRSLAFNRNY